jgi:hypothetical protein
VFRTNLSQTRLVLFRRPVGGHWNRAALRTAQLHTLHGLTFDPVAKLHKCLDVTFCCQLTQGKYPDFSPGPPQCVSLEAGAGELAGCIGDGIPGSAASVSGLAFLEVIRLQVLWVAAAAGSALCWWPVIIQPNLDLPVWKTPLIFLALITAFATALSNEGAGWLMSASILGVFAGICCGFRLWPRNNNDPFIIGLATLVSLPVSVIAVAAGVALRESKIAQKNRRLLWCAFLSSFAFAPTVVALTPLLLTRRR